LKNTRENVPEIEAQTLWFTEDGGEKLRFALPASLSVRYLVRYFETRTLRPFAIYSLLVGAVSLVRFAIF
jgi:hypothetical protein